MSGLPEIPSARRGDHVRFELSGGNARAIAILRRRLGTLRATRAVATLVRRQLTTDPFSNLPPVEPDQVGEWLTRRQLGPVLLLSDILQQDLGLSAQETRSILGELVDEVGALLLSRRFPPLDPRAWAAAPHEEREGVARAVFARLGNISAAEVQTTDGSLALDVRRCRFVELCAEVGKPELASLFCAADARFFGRSDSPVTLERSGTLATGASCCDFRFTLPPVEP